MAENTEAFFRELAAEEFYPQLQEVSGTWRFDIEGKGSWHLTINKGHITVAQNKDEAECVMVCSAQQFDRLARGEMTPLIAGLQGLLDVHGRFVLFAFIQRLFPAPIEKIPTEVPAIPDHPTEASLSTMKKPEEQQPAPPVRTTSILEGNTFVVCDLRGDIVAGPTDTQGLFAWDTRHLSHWKLTVNGITPRSLSVDDLDYYADQFFLVPTTGTVYVDATLSVVRSREVGLGFREHITILNHANDPVNLVVRIEAGSDFADLFEVKDALTKRGNYYQRVESDRLVLGYQREQYRRETWIQPSEAATIDEHSLTFQAHIEPHGQWTTSIDVQIVSARMAQLHPQPAGHAAVKDKDLDEWLNKAPKLSTNAEAIERTYQRSLVDLAALRFFPRTFSERAIPAAGLPWFMTVFGRDSIITSYQALPFFPELAENTLLTLTALQGVRLDDFRDEDPGKIIHEIRYGEMTAFEERPQSPYYGAADVTPLFLILLDEYERWTGNHDVVRLLEKSAREALKWIDEYGDRDGDGYVEYNRRNTKTGLENQCWKDSWNSILFADGTLSKLPRATCEIQGYVYDAKVRCARLAREIWGDVTLAQQLEKQAEELKQRFNKDFWIPERNFFALAIDGERRIVDSLTSNIGHLLWSGIADKEHARLCVHHLMSDRLFSGWGVRTMADGEGGYNPIGYHIGTIWPHDNSIIAMGCARYGYREEAARIASAVFEATPYFQYRLPEAYAGYPRELTHYPVEYPTACSPQAWATGAPLLLLRTLLGLEPIGDRLLVDPVLPKEIEWITLLDIPGRWGKRDAFGRTVEKVQVR